MDMDIDDFRAVLYIIKQNRPEFELKLVLIAYDNSVRLLLLYVMNYDVFDMALLHPELLYFKTPV
jgi:hypothetical protein